MPWPAGSEPWRSRGGDLPECPLQFGGQAGVVPLDPAFTADQHMVGAGDAMIRQGFASEGAEAPLHPVADHRIADLLRHSEADAHRRVVIAARADEQDEAGHGGALAAVGGQKSRAFGGRDWGVSFLRPRARRAFSTLRPPTVAMRARNPCRRLRTRLLGWKVRFIAHAFKNRMKRAAEAAVVGGADSRGMR